MSFKQINYGIKILKYCILSLFLIYAFKWVSKYAKAKNNKRKLEKISVGMTKDEVIRLMGEPNSNYKERYNYNINANLIYPMSGIIEINNGVVDTIYILED